MAFYEDTPLPVSVPGIGYTLKHRLAVEKLIIYYCGQAVGREDGNGEIFTKEDLDVMRRRGRCHDMDKILTSMCYPQLTADYLHRLFATHHEEGLLSPEQRSKYDWMEMIFDMESAKYTKPDKWGGGAYAFAKKRKQNIMPWLMPYFSLFGLDKEDSGLVPHIKESLERDYYEADLLKAVEEYLHTTRLHFLNGVARLDDKGFWEVFDKPVPFRHPATDQKGGTLFHRPSELVEASENFSHREMMHGEYEAQLFDMDALCGLSEKQLQEENEKALDYLDVLFENGKQR
ncbi:MAG: hypothetical protein E7280_06425 [Lachnospiraceae bacterium]|jgi:hypothetical protein|nr:hypothetical protein [Lachnospiraceae bacterium]